MAGGRAHVVGERGGRGVQVTYALQVLASRYSAGNPRATVLLPRNIPDEEKSAVGGRDT